MSGMTGRGFVLAGAVLGFLSVAFGAFGAHALKESLHMDPTWLAVWQTGVQYQMAHALALLFLGTALDRFTPSGQTFAVWTGRLFAVGAVLFSGSLYVLAATSLMAGGPVKALGAITPFGGLCFLVGWAVLAVAALRGDNDTVVTRPEDG
jgi:uncharacterized membrane protein YgdD (TMEM256/DUF423 family)